MTHTHMYGNIGTFLYNITEYHVYKRCARMAYDEHMWKQIVFILALGSHIEGQLPTKTHWNMGRSTDT